MQQGLFDTPRKEAKARLARVLRNDPGMGVIRHADAGYEIARDPAKEYGLDLKERINKENDQSRS